MTRQLGREPGVISYSGGPLYDDWPTHPETVPLYGHQLREDGKVVWWDSERPLAPPYEVRWIWRWSACDGLRGISSDERPTQMTCTGAVDFTCPVHS